jgi:hypothetical protein
MSRAEFEPTIPAFVEAKRVHAADRGASVLGRMRSRSSEIPSEQKRDTCKQEVERMLVVPTKRPSNNFVGPESIMTRGRSRR